MKRSIKSFDDFATFRQTTSIAYSIWERAYGMQYDQQTAVWTSQLVEYQLEAADKLEDGKLRDQLLRAYGRFRTKSLEGRPISPIDVMNSINNFVADKVDLKTPNNHCLERTGFGLQPITSLVNRQ